MIPIENQTTSQIGNQQRIQNKRRVNSESNVNSILHPDENNDILLTVLDDKNKDKTHRHVTINYTSIERQNATPRKSFKLKNSFNFDDEDLRSEEKNQKDYKSQLLERLREKNLKLKNKIYQVEKIQQQHAKRTQQQRQRSFDQVRFKFSTKDSLTKQLSNVYTKIKRYETQIKQIKRIDNRNQSKKISNLSQTLEQIQLVRRQRSKNLERIKRVNKKIQDKIENYKKGQFEQKIKILLRQIQYLKQKQKQMIANQDKRKEKLQKQKKYLSKIEKQLIQGGVAKQFIFDLRNRVINGEDEKQKQENATRQITKKEMFEQFKRSERESEIVQKLIKEQQKTLQNLIQKQKIAAIAEKKTISQLQQLDEEMKYIQQKIAQVRQKINPTHLKPKPIPPKDTTKQDQKIQQIQHLKQVRKRFFDRKKSKYLKKIRDQSKQKSKLQQSKKQVNQSSQTKFNQVFREHIFEKHGQKILKSVQYSDKHILEQLSSHNCRITGITVYFSQGFLILGLKAQYNHKYEGLMHIFTNQTDHQEKQIYENDKNTIPAKQIREQHFSCSQNQFIKQIKGKFSQDNALKNLQVFTNQHNHYKFLAAETQVDHEIKLQQFTLPSESYLYPMFIFGYLNQKGVCQFGVCSVKIETKN